MGLIYLWHQLLLYNLCAYENSDKRFRLLLYLRKYVSLNHVAGHLELLLQNFLIPLLSWPLTTTSSRGSSSGQKFQYTICRFICLDIKVIFICSIIQNSTLGNYKCQLHTHLPDHIVILAVIPQNYSDIFQQCGPLTSRAISPLLSYGRKSAYSFRVRVNILQLRTNICQIYAAIPLVAVNLNLNALGPNSAELLQL